MFYVAEGIELVVLFSGLTIFLNKLSVIRKNIFSYRNFYAFVGSTDTVLVYLETVGFFTAVGGLGHWSFLTLLF